MTEEKEKPTQKGKDPNVGQPEVAPDELSESDFENVAGGAVGVAGDTSTSKCICDTSTDPPCHKS